MIGEKIYVRFNALRDRKSTKADQEPPFLGELRYKKQIEHQHHFQKLNGKKSYLENLLIKNSLDKQQCQDKINTIQNEIDRLNPNNYFFMRKRSLLKNMLIYFGPLFLFIFDLLINLSIFIKASFFSSFLESLLPALLLALVLTIIPELLVKNSLKESINANQEVFKSSNIFNNLQLILIISPLLIIILVATLRYLLSNTFSYEILIITIILFIFNLVIFLINYLIAVERVKNFIPQTIRKLEKEKEKLMTKLSNLESERVALENEKRTIEVKLNNLNEYFSTNLRELIYLYQKILMRKNGDNIFNNFNKRLFLPKK